MSPSLITEELIHFPSLGNRLEGILGYPDDDRPSASILFLSPHPHMGGNMDNNVVLHLARRFSEEGLLTLRFNYRGVGKSEIDLSESAGLFDYWAALEKEERYDDLMPDVMAAYQALEEMAPKQIPMVVVGYSLGAILALKVLQRRSPQLLVVISPPNKKRALPSLEGTSVPVHCIGGEKDFVFDPDLLEKNMEKLEYSISLTRLPDADHFFRKQEAELFQQILQGVSDRIEPSDIERVADA